MSTIHRRSTLFRRILAAAWCAGFVISGLTWPVGPARGASAEDSNNTKTADARVGQWDLFETSVTNEKNYGDPYRDVTLEASYTKPDGNRVEFPGFYDGETTWRIRFMPDQLGTWSYEARFSDGSPGSRGQFECVESDLPGMVAHDETNPRWFGFKGGKHLLVRSLHVGDRYFAANWPDSDRQAFLDWAQEQRYNMLSIASHYVRREEEGRGRGWDTPNLWPLDASEYREMETHLDELARRRVMVYPFAGVFGQDAELPDNAEDRTLYIRYLLSRIGPYWNILLNVGGPEADGYMSEERINVLGREIAEADVFGHLLSVHTNDVDRFPNEIHPFSDQPWVNYIALQGKETTDPAELSESLLKQNPGGKPVYAQEQVWFGNTLQPGYSREGIGKLLWVILLSAGSLNVGDMQGNSSSGFSGSMDLSEREQWRHDMVHAMWDFLESIPYYRLDPHPEVVDNGVCLAEPGQRYLIYLPEGGAVNVDAPPANYRVEWIDGGDPTRRQEAGSTESARSLRAPGAGDWLLHLVREDR